MNYSRLWIHTYTMDLGVWDCHLCLGGLMKINLDWSDSSLSSQADRPGGTVYTSWCWVAGPGPSGFKSQSNCCQVVVGWLVVLSCVQAPAFCKITLSPVIKMGLVLLSCPSWSMKSLCFVGQSTWFRDGPMTLSGPESHNNFAVIFENEVFLVCNGFRPSEKEVWSFGHQP